MAGDRVYTAEMGQPPMDPEVAPATPKKKKPAPPPPAPKMKDTPQHSPIWTEQSGIPVPQEPEVAKPTKKAGGGMTASARADGIAQRGKTRGTLIACGGGYMKGKK